MNNPLLKHHAARTPRPASMQSGVWTSKPPKPISRKTTKPMNVNLLLATNLKPVPGQGETEFLTTDLQSIWGYSRALHIATAYCLKCNRPSVVAHYISFITAPACSCPFTSHTFCAWCLLAMWEEEGEEGGDSGEGEKGVKQGSLMGCVSMDGERGRGSSQQPACNTTESSCLNYQQDQMAQKQGEVGEGWRGLRVSG